MENIQIDNGKVKKVFSGVNYSLREKFPRSSGNNSQWKNKQKREREFQQSVNGRLHLVVFCFLCVCLN